MDLTEEREEQLNESALRLEVARKATAVLLQYPNNQIEKVIVFGSTARGDANQASDIDMCVVFNDSVSSVHYIMLSGNLQDFLEQHGFKAHGVHLPMCLDFTFIPQRYFDNPTEGFVETIGNAKKEGRTLYPVPIGRGVDE